MRVCEQFGNLVPTAIHNKHLEFVKAFPEADAAYPFPKITPGLGLWLKDWMSWLKSCHAIVTRFMPHTTEATDRYIETGLYLIEAVNFGFLGAQACRWRKRLSVLPPVAAILLRLATAHVTKRAIESFGSSFSEQCASKGLADHRYVWHQALEETVLRVGLGSLQADEKEDENAVTKFDDAIIGFLAAFGWHIHNPGYNIRDAYGREHAPFSIILSDKVREVCSSLDIGSSIDEIARCASDRISENELVDLLRQCSEVVQAESVCVKRKMRREMSKWTYESDPGLVGWTKRRHG